MKDDKYELTERVANFIRDKRTAMGMSQREFAIHVFDDASKKNWICSIENGRPITLITLERIFKKIDADISILEH